MNILDINFFIIPAKQAAAQLNSCRFTWINYQGYTSIKVTLAGCWGNAPRNFLKQVLLKENLVRLTKALVPWSVAKIACKALITMSFMLSEYMGC
jgi:hypothetical protein